MDFLKFSILVIFLINFASLSLQISVEEQLTLTYKQKLQLDEFKRIISPKLPHDYMKEEIYLIQWLRESNFDLKGAEKRIVENLKWRKQNKIDTIINEDFSDFEEAYPIEFLGCDFEGRPVASTPVGLWDFRKAVVSGQRDRMLRYSYKLWEEVSVFIRQMQAANRTVTQYVSLLDLANINVVQNMCPACMPVYMTLTTQFEKYYPGMTHQTIIVNAPSFMNEAMSLFKPLMSRALRESIHVFGPNKKQWQKYLFSQIPRENLSASYGGLNENPMTLEDVRKLKALPC